MLNRPFFPNGVFIAAHLTDASSDIILDWFRRLDLDVKPLPKSELHVTISYSKVGLFKPYPLLTDAFPVRTQSLVRIGNALAVTLVSTWLHSRSRLATALGARSSFGGYTPHLSLCYEVPENFQIPNPLRIPMPSEIVLCDEYAEMLKPK